MNSLSLEEKLRKQRQTIWRRFAQAALENSMPAADLCQEWSQAADTLLQEAFTACFAGAPIALFALGKLGSFELNLSSDVDILLVAADDSEISLSALRKFQKILSERTADGFVFRVDFDLRPGGKQGPLIPTVEQFKDYYGNYGETWERLALVRLRPICGLLSIQSEIISFANKFSFRKHLDFTLLDDLKSLRTKIQGHYWERTQNDVIDLKLGIGGIRDIELFAHALLVIHGGRDSSLQTRSTTRAFELLTEKQLLPEDEGQFLVKHYWNLRSLENYVQALNDEQTHLLSTTGQHPPFVANALLSLAEEMQHCERIVRSLLGDAPSTISVENELLKVGLPERDLQEIWNEILDDQVFSRNKARDEALRKAFLIEFLNALKEQNGDVRKGLLLLKDFIHSTRAKASFFTLLVREKILMRKLAWLFGHSPYLGRILCNRPELLDSFVYKSQNQHSEDLSLLLEELAEKRLLSELINGSEFLENKDLTKLIYNLSSTADFIANTLLNVLNKEYSASIEILALGKWGGRELGFRSDLDFIFVVKQEPTENDFKVAKRFINRLTEPHRGGNIYSIDMRLRPSGKAGPLVITEQDLQNYLHSEAAAWERQAYLKARWIHINSNGPSSHFIYRGVSNEELSELARIREQLISDPNKINLKLREGGLIDIELALQTSWLINKQVPNSTQTSDFFSVWGDRGTQLQQNYNRLRQIEQMYQLVASETFVDLQLNHESFQALALALHTSSINLHKEIQTLLEDNSTILKELDPRRQPH